MKRNEEKTLEIAFRNFSRSGHTDRQIDSPRDTPYYRDARTHLKIENKPRIGLEENSLTLKMVL